MRLTESHLRKIVKEELKKVLNEIGPVADMPPEPPAIVQQVGEEQAANVTSAIASVIEKLDAIRATKAKVTQLDAILKANNVTYTKQGDTTTFNYGTNPPVIINNTQLANELAEIKTAYGNQASDIEGRIQKAVLMEKTKFKNVGALYDLGSKIKSANITSETLSAFEKDNSQAEWLRTVRTLKAGTLLLVFLFAVSLMSQPPKR